MPRPRRATPRASKLAVTLRQPASSAETKLWGRLRNRLLSGYKFCRQFPVGPYIADFACVEAKLIVEVDGSQHASQREYDKARSEILADHGYTVIRFGANEVMQNLETVLFAILQKVRHHT